MKKFLTLILLIHFPIILNPESKYESQLFKILKKKEIVVSVGDHYEPYYIENPKPDFPGFEVEIAQMYADFLGVTLKEIVPLRNFKEHAKAIESGRIDIALGNSSSMQRMKYVYFSDPYILVSIGGLVNKNIVPSESDGDIVMNKTYRSLSDIVNLNRLSFGVKANTSNQEYIEKNYGQYSLQTFDDDEIALNALKDNKINCYIGDNLYIEGLMQKYPSLRNQFIPLVQPVMEKQLSVAFKKYDLQLAYSLNLFIREMKRTGELSRLRHKYFNSNQWVKKN
jgi:polar amino acid transport system substrate-binding protein